MPTRKMCWWITEKCNENCVYCFRSLSSINRFSFEEHLQILEGILAFGTDQITWSGGEALLVPHTPALMRRAKDCGIFNKVTTNGKLLTADTIAQIAPFTDLVALSIDSLNDATNIALGRGAEHRKTVFDRIRSLTQAGITVDVNTVVTRYNLADLEDMAAFFREHPLSGKWKLMTFFPVREKALENKDRLSIPDETFLNTVHRLIDAFPELNITYMMNDEIQQQYPGVRANGDLLVTRHGVDRILGNMLTDSPENPFTYSSSPRG